MIADPESVYQAYNRSGAGETLSRGQIFYERRNLSEHSVDIAIADCGKSLLLSNHGRLLRLVDGNHYSITNGVISGAHLDAIAISVSL